MDTKNRLTITRSHFVQQTCIMHLDNLVNQIKTNTDVKSSIQYFFQNTWPSCLGMIKQIQENSDSQTQLIVEKIKYIIQNEKVKEDSILKLEVEI
jgi:hypothetical protein